MKLYKHLKDFEDEIIHTNTKDYLIPTKLINQSSKILDDRINNIYYKNITTDSSF